MTKTRTTTRHSARQPAPGRAATQINRHRQARIRLQPRPTSGPQRFEHLKRVYD